MIIQIKNLGPLEQAEFELGSLTIICGRNNTGKTYATYALYGFLSLWREVFSIDIEPSILSGLFEKGSIRLDLNPYIGQADQIVAKGCKDYIKRLPMVFASSEDRFSETEFSISIRPDEINPTKRFERKIRAAKTELFSLTKEEGCYDLVITLLAEKQKSQLPAKAIADVIGDAVKEIIFGDLFPNLFIASAERTGAAIFQRELNFLRNRIMEELNQPKKNINPIELLFKDYRDYPLPVKTNVQFTRDLESIAKQKSFISENYPEILSDFIDLIGGDYGVSKNDVLYYSPRRKHLKLTMDESSSAVRSLLDIVFYIRHVAKPGDLLMIDEPELNLHPENQRRIARLMTRLVKLGIRVFITTHSDYIIKELNTLIMLNQDKPYLNKIMTEEKYRSEELISYDKIKVYIAEKASRCKDGNHRRSNCQTLSPADITPELGIEAKSFDDTIDQMNRIQESIIWGDDQ